MQLGTPGGRSYSTRFEDHEGLLHKFARKGFGRLIEAGVSVEYDDVYGQMSLYFVQASQKFNPQNGNTFTAYLGRVCFNNFNKWASDLVGEQIQLGLMRIEDMAGDEDERDFYETLGGSAESPEDIVERLEYTVHALTGLSPDSMAVLRSLKRHGVCVSPPNTRRRGEWLNDDERRISLPTIATLCRELGMNAGRIAAVKQELSSAFQVKL